MSDLDPRGLEAAARASHPQFRYWLPKDEAEVSSQEVAEAAVTAYFAVTQPVVKTVHALKALPVEVVVLSAAGTIACRADESAGVVFGDERPFPWTSLMLPARVIWRPHD